MSIRVLIVDDSATARAVLKEMLNSAPGIEVAGVCPDAYTARDKIDELKPDVVCLDVEMPRMDGVTFLKKLMRYMPTPVLMVSSLTREGAKTTLDALEAGAIDYVTKPHSNIYDGAEEIKKELIEKVKIVAKAKVQPKLPPTSKPTQASYHNTALAETTKKIIAIGASTGGTEAIKVVLSKLPATTPGIVIVQHMPPSFTKAFATRLNSLCDMEVKEAENGEYIETGKVLIANGSYHMVVRRSGARYYVELGGGQKVSGHKPSVDVLFNSVAKNVGANALGVILTGMGADGAKGMLNMKNAGSKTIAQDERTCVVFGMPKVAIDLGGVQKICPLDRIPQEMLTTIETMR
ncbi:MAG: protein-glutamate methylesterase/protein-glutamine glutaminase [Campylobacterales bacterium]